VPWSLLHKFPDDGGDLFSPPWSIKAFSQFWVLLKHGHSLQKSNYLLVGPVVRKVQLKPVHDLLRTAESLSTLPGMLTPKISSKAITISTKSRLSIAWGITRTSYPQKFSPYPTGILTCLGNPKGQKT
jgi:hypothetical protein